MGKVVSVPPPIPKQDIAKEGTNLVIKEARIATNVYTSLGSVKKALALTIELGKEEYSHLFSLDRDPITGSVGRLLVSIGIDNTDAKDLDAKVKALEGKTVRVTNRGGKLYWYP